MRWNDRVYGEVTIDDPRLLALIACPTFQRLRGIRQAGPSAFAFPFKTVTRYEHSLGVHLLLRTLGADLREQVAGLLHDISHTAFSHAVDFVFSSEEQDHHEQLKHEFLDRDDIVAGLRPLGFSPEDFSDDSVYPLLERPIPWLCADRLDYFFRDGLACGVLTPEEVAVALAHLTSIDRTIVFTDLAVARAMVAKFAVMNRDWWAGPTEAFIYNEFADALREGFRLGVLHEEDLLADDAHVLARLQAASSPLIAEKLDHVLNFRPERVACVRPPHHPQDPLARPAGAGRVDGEAAFRGRGVDGSCTLDVLVTRMPYDCETAARRPGTVTRPVVFVTAMRLRSDAASSAPRNGSRVTIDPRDARSREMWRAQVGSVSGKSRRVWTPRDSSRAMAAAIISRATVSMFCSVQPAGSSKTWPRT